MNLFSIILYNKKSLSQIPKQISIIIKDLIFLNKFKSIVRKFLLSLSNQIFKNLQESRKQIAKSLLLQKIPDRSESTVRFLYYYHPTKSWKNFTSPSKRTRSNQAHASRNVHRFLEGARGRVDTVCRCIPQVRVSIIPGGVLVIVWRRLFEIDRHAWTRSE